MDQATLSARANAAARGEATGAAPAPVSAAAAAAARPRETMHRTIYDKEHIEIAKGWLLRRGRKYDRVRGEYGANSRETMLKALTKKSAEALADEVWDAERLYKEQESINICLEELSAAFADIRQHFA